MINDIKAALEVLQKGGVILYPTDTIWGIGCDACNEKPHRLQKHVGSYGKRSFTGTLCG